MNESQMYHGKQVEKNMILESMMTQQCCLEINLVGDV